MMKPFMIQSVIIVLRKKEAQLDTDSYSFGQR